MKFILLKIKVFIRLIYSEIYIYFFTFTFEIYLIKNTDSMKISKIYLAVLVLLPFTMNAQPVYQLGSNVVGFGLGVGGNFGLSSSYQSAPAINFQYEHGLKQVGPGVLSLGAYLGFKKYSYSSSFWVIPIRKTGNTLFWVFVVHGIYKN